MGKNPPSEGWMHQRAMEDFEVHKEKIKERILSIIKDNGSIPRGSLLSQLADFDAIQAMTVLDRLVNEPYSQIITTTSTDSESSEQIYSLTKKDANENRTRYKRPHKRL